MSPHSTTPETSTCTEQPLVITPYAECFDVPGDEFDKWFRCVDHALRTVLRGHDFGGLLIVALHLGVFLEWVRDVGRRLTPVRIARDFRTPAARPMKSVPLDLWIWWGAF